MQKAVSLERQPQSLKMGLESSVHSSVKEVGPLCSGPRVRLEKPSVRIQTFKFVPGGGVELKGTPVGSLQQEPKIRN